MMEPSSSGSSHASSSSSSHVHRPPVNTAPTPDNNDTSSMGAAAPGALPAAGLQCSRCKKILRPGEKYRNKSHKLCSSCYVNHYNSASQKAKRKYDQHRKIFKDPNFDPNSSGKERRKRNPVIHLNGKVLPAEEHHIHPPPSYADYHDGLMHQQQQQQQHHSGQQNHPSHSHLSSAAAQQQHTPGSVLVPSAMPFMPLMPPSYALMSLTAGSTSLQPRDLSAIYARPNSANGSAANAPHNSYNIALPPSPAPSIPSATAGTSLERYALHSLPTHTSFRPRLIGGGGGVSGNTPTTNSTIQQLQQQGWPSLAAYQQHLQQQQQQQQQQAAAASSASTSEHTNDNASAAPAPSGSSTAAGSGAPSASGSSVNPVAASTEKGRPFEARVDALANSLMAQFASWQSQPLLPSEYPRTAELEVQFKRTIGDEWTKYRLQFLTGRRLLDRVTSSDSRDPMVYPHAFERVATVELLRGRPLLAIEFLNGALQLLESRQRKVEMLLVLQKLSLAYGTLQCIEEEELFFLLAARLGSIIFSPAAMTSVTLELKAIFHHNNAIRHLRARRFDDAEHEHQESARILEPMLVSKRPPGLFCAVRQLKAILSTCKGDYVDATMTSESLLKMTKELYGVHHIRIAESLHNYGLTMFVTEQWDFSFEYLQEALKIKCELLGESHPSTLLTLQGLGMLNMKKTPLSQQYLFRLFEPRPIMFTVSDVDVEDT